MKYPRIIIVLLSCILLVSGLACGLFGEETEPSSTPTPTPSSSLPSAPTLLSPNNAVVVFGTSVTYKWEPVDGATGYILGVNTVNHPLSFQTYKRYAVLGDVNTHLDTGYFLDSTTYYWWVWATNADGLSPGAEVIANGRSFISKH